MAKVTFEQDGASDPDGNVAHIARHGVTPAEAEFVAKDDRNPTIRSASSSYPVRFGSTKAGRYLAVVFSAIGRNPKVGRVITAYDATKPQRRP